MVEFCVRQQQLVSTSTHSQPPNALTLMHFLYNSPVAGCSDAHLQNAEAAVNSAAALNVAASEVGAYADANEQLRAIGVRLGRRDCGKCLRYVWEGGTLCVTKLSAETAATLTCARVSATVEGARVMHG